MHSISSTNTEKKRVILNPQGKNKKPAQVDGIPTWTVTDGKCTLDVAADGKSAFLISADDDAGISHVTVLVDADLGAGVKDLSEIIEYTVTGEEADSLGLSDEPAVPK